MIFAPVSLMVFMATWTATSVVTPSESPAAVLGSAQASLGYAGAVPVQQSPDGTVTRACNAEGVTGGSGYGMPWQYEAGVWALPTTVLLVVSCLLAVPYPWPDTTSWLPASLLGFSILGLAASVTGTLLLIPARVLALRATRPGGSAAEHGLGCRRGTDPG